MPELYDDLISDALGEFRDAELSDAGPVPAAATVRATVARRRTVRLATLSVLGVLLVAAPIAAFAANSPDHRTPPVTGESNSPTPVETVSPTPSVGSSPPAAPPAPDGRITVQKLTSTRVDVPVLGDACPGGHRRLAKSKGAEPWVEKIVYTNLDDDPAIETAALLFCPMGEIEASQAVAFDLDAAGKIRTLGQIATMGPDLHLRDITARAAGGITAEVSDMIACCEASVSDEQHQNRSYAWNGTKFAQVGGPTVFGDPRYVTDLQVLVTDATLGPAVNGKRSGTATVTVRNNGPAPSGRFEVSFGNCNFSCHDGVPDWAWGDHNKTYQPPLAAGKSTKTTITVSFDANTPGGSVTAYLTVVGRSNTKEMTDLKPTNNFVAFKVRLS